MWAVTPVIPPRPSPVVEAGVGGRAEGRRKLHISPEGCFLRHFTDSGAQVGAAWVRTWHTPQMVGERGVTINQP